MKILAIDTANKIASVAVSEGDLILGEKFSEDQKTHSEKLLPIIDELLKELKLALTDINVFCVCTGPGSFTGIRIGVATIKGMAQALKKDVIGVTALQGIFEANTENNICAIIDAKHDNVYTQYRINGKCNVADCKNIEEVIEEIKNINENITFSGDGVIPYGERIKDGVNCKINEEFITEKASDLIHFALKNKIEAVNPKEINPVYLRKSQPER